MAAEMERYRAEVKFQHKFENISQRLLDNSDRSISICSPQFFARNIPFRLYLNRKQPAIACDLVCDKGEEANEISFDFEYTLTLITPSKKIQSKKFSWTNNLRNCVYRTFLSKTFPGQEIVVDDAITLEVELWAGEPEGMTKFKPPKEQLRQDLQLAENQGRADAAEQLLNSGDFSDLTFVVEEDSSEVKAHTAILALNSHVFARMLTTDMTEAKDKEIKIVDMGAPALKIMLRYIYSGQLGFPKGVKIDLQICQELANAGEKYDLQNLKEYAAMAMTEFVSLENVWELLKFAKRLKAEAATKALTEYYLENVRKIIEKL